MKEKTQARKAGIQVMEAAMSLYEKLMVAISAIRLAIDLITRLFHRRKDDE